MNDPKLCLTWDTYQKNICNGLGLLQQRGEFVDMTIAADGHHVKVHQMVMSLVSPYIKELVTVTQCPHPVIFLNKVSYLNLQSILEYAYTGEVMVHRDRLDEFLEACQALQIKGFDHESMKTGSNGGLLRLREDKTNCTDEIKILTDNTTEKPAQTGIKRKMTDTMNDTDDDYHGNDDDTHMMDDDTYEEINNTTNDDLKQNEQITKMPKTSMVQYSLSCQGSIQLVLNRFIYRMRHTRIKNNERVWRCAEYDRQRCRAFAVTVGDVIKERGCVHNHPFHDKQILKKVQKGNLFTAYNTVLSMASMQKSSSKNTQEQHNEDST